MGLKILQVFEADLQLALGNRGFSSDQLRGWVNLGLEDLTSQHIFEELDGVVSEVVLAGMNSFTPVFVEGITDLQNVTDKLGMSRVEEARWNRFDQAEEGQPQFWFRRASEILVWPTAKVDTVIGGDKLSTHAPLGAPGDVTVLQSMWDRAVHLLAMYHALTDLEEPNRAVYFMKVSGQYIAQRVDLREVDSEATGMPVQPVNSYEELVRQRRNARVIFNG